MAPRASKGRRGVLLGLARSELHPEEPIVCNTMTPSVSRVRPREAKRDNSSTSYSRTNSRTAKICVESKFFAGEIKKKKKRRGYINLDNTKDL